MSKQVGFDYDLWEEIEITCQGKKEADENGPAYEMFSQYEILSQIPKRYLKRVIGYSLPSELGDVKGVKEMKGVVKFQMPIYKGKLPQEVLGIKISMSGEEIK